MLGDGPVASRSGGLVLGSGPAFWQLGGLGLRRDLRARECCWFLTSALEVDGHGGILPLEVVAAMDDVVLFPLFPAPSRYTAVSRGLETQPAHSPLVRPAGQYA